MLMVGAGGPEWPVSYRSAALAPSWVPVGALPLAGRGRSRCWGGLRDASRSPRREGSCGRAAPTQWLVAVRRSATPPWARSAPPSPFEIFQGEG